LRVLDHLFVNGVRAAAHDAINIVFKEYESPLKEKIGEAR